MKPRARKLTARRRRGQPIVVLALVLIGWTGLRFAIWESPFPQLPLFPPVAANMEPQTYISSVPAQSNADDDVELLIAAKQPDRAMHPPRMVVMDRPAAPGLQPIEPAMADHSMLVSHQLMYLTAMGQLRLTRDLAMKIPGADNRTGPHKSDRAAQGGPRKARRWSADGWLFLRPGAPGANAPGPRFASYGASQTGAVLRYRLDPANSARPTAFVRATKALASGREAELAAGLSARPVAAVPVAAYAEVRVTRGAASTEVRPAAFVVTEIPPIDLLLGLQAEVYGAAGYVGGRFATGFVDGQARVDHAVADFDLGRLRVGAGVWGGAQKGAARLDIGPSARVDVKVGPVPARVSVDYRLRVAGSAQPNSGVALTLSTGF